MRLSIVAKGKADRPGPAPLYVRVSHNRVERYVALGFRVEPGDWNPKREQMRGASAEAKRLNKILGQKAAAAAAAADEVTARLGRSATADEYKAAVELAVHPPKASAEEAPAAALGLVGWARKVRDGKRAAGKVGTALVYGTAANHLEASLGGRDVALGAVTPSLLRQHAERLEAPPESGGMGQAVNYVNRQMRTLRTVCRLAAADEAPGADAALRAVTSLRFKTEKVQKERLTREQVRELEVAAAGGGSLTALQRDALDLWLFAFYVGGMRFGDVMRLRWSHIARDRAAGAGGMGTPTHARWRAAKTGDAMAIPLLPQAREILARWEGRHPTHVFGISSDRVEANPEEMHREKARQSARVRKHMRLISKKVGVPYVGFHGARHSLADYLWPEGVPVATISQVLGHSSISVTQAYLSGFDSDAVAGALQLLED